jgi:hypothetical protein
MSEARILRQRQEDALSLSNRRGGVAADGSLAILVAIQTLGTYPTVPNAFYAIAPVLVDGSEAEGTTASFTVEAGRILYGYNLGIKIPPIGTYVIAHSCGGRWVFRYDGGAALDVGI